MGKYDREGELSTSQITSFQRCKRQWWLQYHRQIQYGDRGSKPVTVGNLIHGALEVLYSPGDKREPLDVMQELIEDMVKAEPQYEVEIRNHGSLATTMMVHYRAWLEESHADDYLEITASEARLTAPLKGTNWTLTGRVDAKGMRMGSRVVMDHKTVDGFDVIPKTAQINHQFLTYHLLEYLQDDDTPIDSVMVNMIRRVNADHELSRPPYFQRYEIRYNTEELRNHWRHILAVAREISQTIERLDNGENHQMVVPPSPGRDCAYSCAFRTVCPMFDDGSNAEAFIEMQFGEQNGR